jgi:hypothetical protein
VDYGKIGNIIYKYGQQSSSFDPTSQTEDIGNNSRLVPTDLKLAICSGIYQNGLVM